MAWLIRLTAFGIELLGLYFVLKHADEGHFGAALIRLIFDVVVVLVFVSSHVLIETILMRSDTRWRRR